MDMSSLKLLKPIKTYPETHAAYVPLGRVNFFQESFFVSLCFRRLYQIGLLEFVERMNEFSSM